MKLRKPSSEQDMAAKVVAWLKEDLQTPDVYQEVEVRGVGIADIVAVLDRVLWVIEAKLTLSLQVIYQARRWKGMTHCVSVAVPGVMKKSHQHREAEYHLEAEGIGQITVFGRKVRAIGPAMGTVSGAGIGAYLCEQQKWFAMAGNAEGKRWRKGRQS